MSLGVSVSSRPKAVLGSFSSDYLLTVCHQIIFLATGIFTTICNQHIFYQGGAEPSTMLLSFPTYAGMFLVVLLPISRKPAYISQRRVFFSAVFDVGSNVLCMLGLQIVGSGVFQVIQRIYEGSILTLPFARCCMPRLSASTPFSPAFFSASDKGGSNGSACSVLPVVWL